jgi:hypothetical protein
MLIIAIIVGFIYPGILKLIEKNDIATLNNTTDVNLAINIRRKIKRNRILILVLILLLYSIFEIGISIALFNLEDPDTVGNLIRDIGFTAVIMFMYLYTTKGATKAVGCISTTSKQSFLDNHKEYVLFLRGFEDDDYKHEPYVSESLHSTFSEYEFASLISQEHTICAVGMTKEIESPKGALRVYLSDSNWKEDVYDLMHNAQKIYILVNDRNSCIWEIEQSIEMIDKTVYIVDDLQKYDNVRLRISNPVLLPEISANEKQPNNILIIRNLQGSFEVKSYTNNIYGYSLAFGIESEELKKTKKRQKRGKIILIVMGILFGLPIAILLIASIYYSITDKDSKDQNSEDNIVKSELLIDTFLIDTFVEEINRMCPMVISPSIKLTEIIDKKPYLIYNYSIDESIIDFDTIESSLPQLEEYSMQSIKQEFKDILVNSQYGIIYMYTGQQSNRTCQFTLETNEISRSAFELSDEVSNEVIDIYLRESSDIE